VAAHGGVAGRRQRRRARAHGGGHAAAGAGGDHGLAHGDPDRGRGGSFDPLRDRLGVADRGRGPSRRRLPDDGRIAAPVSRRPGGAMERLFFGLGALSALIAVGLGAFGAHGLRTRVAPDMLVTFETGARYQMYHALALLAVGWASGRWPNAGAPL